MFPNLESVEIIINYFSDLSCDNSRFLGIFHSGTKIHCTESHIRAHLYSYPEQNNSDHHHNSGDEPRPSASFPQYTCGRYIEMTMVITIINLSLAYDMMGPGVV